MYIYKDTLILYKCLGYYTGSSIFLVMLTDDAWCLNTSWNVSYFFHLCMVNITFIVFGREHIDLKESLVPCKCFRLYKVLILKHILEGYMNNLKKMLWININNIPPEMAKSHNNIHYTSWRWPWNYLNPDFHQKQSSLSFLITYSEF